MLDRFDRAVPRKRGTDLVRVQQTRALLRHGRDRHGGKQLPAIYLSELGPGRLVTRLKWFVSTVIVAIAGLLVIGIVIYASLQIGDGSGMFGAMKRAGIEAMKPKAGSTPGQEKTASMGQKTDRIVVSSKGLVTRNLIYEQIVQRRGTRDFILNKPYARVVASFATEKPDGAVNIPPFDPIDLVGNNAPIARKDSTSNDVTSDPRVTVKFADATGGTLPNEDNQELSNDEVERLVAEADAIYTESEASLTGVEPESDKAADRSDATAGQKLEGNSTTFIKKSDGEQEEDQFDIRIITARGGEAVDAILKAAGVDSIQAGQAADAVSKAIKTRKLKAGEEVRLALTPSEVEEGAVDASKISLFIQGAPILTITRTGGGFEAGGTPVGNESSGEETAGDRATVYVGTYRAAGTQDLPQDFVTKFLKIYSYDVDFKQRVKSGDGFELFYDLIQDDNGGERPGELLFAAITIGNEARGYYRFRTPDGAVDYYDDKGSNSKKFLMKMPVRAGRLTSGYGVRKHPLLGTYKMHTGIDWAGPVGTPIMASGNGSIELAERHGGYGNYVRIRHANGYKTCYGHMLRFAEGVNKGVKVKQGQTIGYVGTTGMSSGPHLHYEVLVNNRFTNPLSLKIPRSRQLQGRLLTEFRKEKGRVDDLMRRAPVKTRVTAVEK